MTSGDDANATAMLVAALDEDADYFDALLNLSALSGRKSDWVVASTYARRAIAVRPDSAEAWTNLGMHLLHMQRFDESELALTRALSLAPDHYAAHHNMGLLRYHQNKAEAAVDYLRCAIKLRDASGASSVGARSDLSLAVMKSGRLNEGMRLNEVRWDPSMLSKFPVWECGLPKWEGEPLDGKTLFLHSEQGFGDAVQFIRFVPELKKRGARVVFAVPGPLVRLLSGQCECDEVVPLESFGALARAARDADFHAPLLSAVCQIGVEFSNLPERSPPYLRPVSSSSPAGRRPKSVRGAGFRVGVVWAASPGYERSRERSVPIEDVLGLAEVPGVRLYSLQVGPYRDDPKKARAENLIVDLVGQIEDFADTVELARQLDLVVCVDTGPFHAVAASGVRSWLVQPACTCWRWAPGVKPWYGCAEEFFQKRPGSWAEPIADMKRALAELIRDG